ncbi:IS3 family transposase [Lysinibacillus sphaericus]
MAYFYFNEVTKQAHFSSLEQLALELNDNVHWFSNIRMMQHWVI